MSDFRVKDGDLFIFQGDSITDCGRRGAAAPFGSGYASMLIEMVTANYPERNIRYINRGISGDKTVGLRDRWEDDVIRHQPNWLSILIGINDLHTYLLNSQPCVSVDVYRQAYDDILRMTREKTDANIVLLDPFYISIAESGQSFRAKVLETIPEYIAVVHEMAAKYDTLHVPMHEIYQEQVKYRDAEAFCPEPVHPNHAGHIVMANALFETLTVG